MNGVKLPAVKRASQFIAYSGRSLTFMSLGFIFMCLCLDPIPLFPLIFSILLCVLGIILSCTGVYKWNKKDELDIEKIKAESEKIKAENEKIKAESEKIKAEIDCIKAKMKFHDASAERLLMETLDNVRLTAKQNKVEIPMEPINEKLESTLQAYVRTSWIRPSDIELTEHRKEVINSIKAEDRRFTDEEKHLIDLEYAYLAGLLTRLKKKK